MAHSIATAPASSPLNRSSQGGLSWLSLSKLPPRLVTRLLSVVLSLMILGMGTVANAALQRGDSGDLVRDLQNRLTAVQCYNGPVTGYFGALTQQAVIACQQRYNLEADGVVGPKTMAALTGESIAQPTQPAPANVADTGLQQGSRGQAVMAMQRDLADRGYYNGGIDGDFGPMTEAAVVAFQRDMGLSQTGVFGEREQNVIATAPKKAPEPVAVKPTTVQRSELAVGDSGDDVMMLQSRLQQLRYMDVSSNTGYFGNVTKGAVKEFQAANRINPTGTADRQTLAALGLLNGEVAVQPQASQPFSTGGFTDGGNGGRPIGRSAAAPLVQAPQTGDGRFVVVIPKQSGVALATVQQLVPTAKESRSKAGQFIEAGTFPTQGAADQQSQLLRAYGLDARVAYR
jgi:peptidoglycan hydrolase-like protein with peptidoglycan-binding domain